MEKLLKYYSVVPSVVNYKTPKYNNPLNKNGWFHWDELNKEEISVYEVWLKEWTVETEIVDKKEDIVYIVEGEYGDEFEGTKQELFEQLGELIDSDILEGSVEDEWEVYNGKEITQLKIFEEDIIYRDWDSEEWFLTEKEALEFIKELITVAIKEY